MRKTGFIFSDIFLLHETGNHPESPERLSAIKKALDKAGLFNHLISIYPEKADIRDIEFIHTKEHIQRVKNLSSITSVPHFSDADTVISPKSYEAALLAAGAVITAVKKISEGKIDNAFCAIRPPGHHAEKDRIMGFCLFNNVAIGAKYALNHTEAKKVFIIDWDVHHGNGTQNSFYDSSEVFFLSLHQSPLYPGTGFKEERGCGTGTGFNKNIPIKAGWGDNEYISIFNNEVTPAIEEFNPDIIFISAGFDGHKDDPLASVNLTAKGYGEMTTILKKTADSVCNGKIISVLEGGYNLDALGESVVEHLTSLLA